MNISARIVMLSAGAFALSGCASIFGGNQASLSDTDRLNMDDIYHDYASEQLHLGRSLMRAGAYASAIDPLRKASNDRQSAPAAYNALGVAYAKLERPDVATRFFQMALLLDPENEKFASNLIRLRDEFQAAPNSDKPSLAAELPALEPKGVEAAPEVAVQTVKASPQIVKSAFGANVVAESGGSGMVRISANEVRIGGERQEAKESTDKFARSEYPIKVKLSPSKQADKGTPTGNKPYPVRVTF